MKTTRRLDDYPEREDAKRVWLNQTDVNAEAGALIDEAQSPQQRAFFRLGTQAGLQREEIVSVTTNIRTSSAHRYAQKHRGGWDPRYHAVPMGWSYHP